jgi:hypothetical protein
LGDTPNIIDPCKIGGEVLMCSKMKLVEKKRKINSILTKICLMKFLTPIPLCKMISMKVVYLALKNDLTFLVKSFANDYIPSFASFYVSLEHENEHMQEVMEEICDTWDDVRKKKLRNLKSSWWKTIFNSS